MIRHYDTIVIGAGPAGLAAGATLGELGTSVLVLDEQAGPGGQIYRNIEECPARRQVVLGDDYIEGNRLAARFRKSGAVYENNATVWQVEQDGEVCYSKGNQSFKVTASFIICATGAMERPMPIPGWTLPGVMGAGAAHNLAKEAGLMPSGKVVLAGTGPLLLLEAELLAKKGVEVSAVLDITPTVPGANAIVNAPKALRRADFLFKGAKMLHTIKKKGIPFYRGVTQIAARGKTRVESVTALHKDTTLSFEVDTLLLHFGVIPNTHVYNQVGCAMEWNQTQRYWYPATDAWGRTSLGRIFAAGDGAGVTGGLAARYKGALAALEVARAVGMIPAYERDALAQPILKDLSLDHWPRPFVDAIFAPRPQMFTFDPDTVICRCENLRVKDIEEMVNEGVNEVNEIKALSRAGMGPCQGRMCGAALAEVVAALTQTQPQEAGCLSVRPPLKPLPFEQVAAMELGSNAATGKNWLLDKK